MPTPDDIEIENLIRWFRQTRASTSFGEVGIVVYLRYGQISTTKRIYTETMRTDGQIEGSRAAEETR